MSTGWKNVKFEAAPIRIIDGDRGNNYPNQSELLDSEHCLFLNTGNVTKDGFKFGKCQFISKRKDEVLRKGKLCRDDVIMTTRGTIGNVAYYNDKVRFDHIRINSGMVIFRCAPETFLPMFLYLFLRSSNLKNQVDALRTGSAQPQLPIRDIKRIDVPFPPLAEQKRIAGIISIYDDLIENNLRRIALLEQSARLLYEEWFGRLRFPGHERVRIKNGVPKGWKKISLSTLCADVRISIDPSEVSGETPYIGLEHIPRRSITLCNWGYAHDVTSNKFRFESGDILFGKIRPYFHKVGFALTDGITSSDAIVIRPKNKAFYLYCLLLLSNDTFVDLASKTVREGSKMPRADWKYLLKCLFLQPDMAVIKIFNDFVEKIVSQLRNLAVQNQKLKQARDLLLHRLMNGEIAI